jgi:Tfp pilus assembly protein PilF
LKLKPDYTEALNNLGAAHLRRKEWDLAIPLFEKVLEDLLYPTPQFPLSNLGWAYLEKQKYLLAETYFSQALDISPEFVTAAHGQARVLLETRRETEAVKFLKARLTENPDAAILHADLARAYEAKGWKTAAENAWRNVLRYAKENSELKKTAAERLPDPD